MNVFYIYFAFDYAQADSPFIGQPELSRRRVQSKITIKK